VEVVRCGIGESMVGLKERTRVPDVGVAVAGQRMYSAAARLQDPWA